MTEWTRVQDKLPDERARCWLVLSGDTVPGCSQGAAFGYLRYGAGDKDSPYFVIPNIGVHGGSVTHWSPCTLPDPWQAPAATRAVAGRDGPWVEVLPLDGSKGGHGPIIYARGAILTIDRWPAHAREALERQRAEWAQDAEAGY